MTVYSPMGGQDRRSGIDHSCGHSSPLIFSCLRMTFRELVTVPRLLRYRTWPYVAPWQHRSFQVVPTLRHYRCRTTSFLRFPNTSSSTPLTYQLVAAGLTLILIIVLNNQALEGMNPDFYSLTPWMRRCCVKELFRHVSATYR